MEWRQALADKHDWRVWRSWQSTETKEELEKRLLREVLMEERRRSQEMSVWSCEGVGTREVIL